MKTLYRTILALTIAAIPLAGAPSDSRSRSRAAWCPACPGKHPSVVAFKGIPFAAPPVGDRRWQAPGPVVPWKGVRKADAFGASCIQSIVQERKPWTYEFMTHNEISEDCLYLNVWTAATSANERRPVFVYIYGGGFTEGSGAVPVYDGEGLATKGLVVVTPNYRVGVLGLPGAPGAVEGERRQGLGQLRPARPDRRPAVGARQHRGLRRRPEPRDDRGPVRRRDVRAQPDRVAAGQGPVPPGHRAERRLERGRGRHHAGRAQRWPTRRPTGRSSPRRRARRRSPSCAR